MLNDYTNKAVLVTGGTKGIGRGIGLAFARRGAQVYLTYKWGSANLDELQAAFAEAGGIEPILIEADVSVDDDTAGLMEQIAARHDGIEVFISNVCVVQIADGVESYTRRSLLKSLEYSAWPMVSYLQAIKKTFAHYPRYVVGISSDGADNYFTGYEFVAISKSVMEVFCRYLAGRLDGESTRVNVLRTRNVPTDAVYEIFGAQYVEFMRKYSGEEYFVQVEEVADAVFALCSGLMDSMSGQVIQLDKGAAFADTMMRWMERREEFGLGP